MTFTFVVQQRLLGRLTSGCTGLAFAGMLGLRPLGQLMPAAERRVVRHRH